MPGKMQKGVRVLDRSDVEIGAEFCKELKQYIKGKGHTLQDNEAINKDLPLLVICYNHSRIGTDIDTATRLEGPIDKANTAIIVMHVTEKHAVPNTMPTENLTDRGYRDYGLLVDFFYTREEKIYECKLNSQAKQNLKIFLREKPSPIEETKPSHEATNESNKETKPSHEATGESNKEATSGCCSLL